MDCTTSPNNTEESSTAVLHSTDPQEKRTRCVLLVCGYTELLVMLDILMTLSLMLKHQWPGLCPGMTTGLLASNFYMKKPRMVSTSKLLKDSSTPGCPEVV